MCSEAVQELMVFICAVLAQKRFYREDLLAGL